MSADLAIVDGSTTSLNRHLLRYHDIDVKSESSSSSSTTTGTATASNSSAATANQEDKQQQPKLLEFVNKKRKLDKESNRYKECTASLVEMITYDLQPFSVVNDKGFRDYSRCLEPRYVLPSTKTLRNKLLPERYIKAMSTLWI